MKCATVRRPTRSCRGGRRGREHTGTRQSPIRIPRKLPINIEHQRRIARSRLSLGPWS